MHVIGSKRKKTHITESPVVRVLHLIGEEDGAIFYDQSQDAVKLGQCHLGMLSTLD